MFYCSIEAFYRSMFFDLLKIGIVVAADIVENAVLCFVYSFLAPYSQLLFYPNCFWQILEIFLRQTVVFLSAQGFFYILPSSFLRPLIKN